MERERTRRSGVFTCKRCGAESSHPLTGRHPRAAFPSQPAHPPTSDLCDVLAFTVIVISGPRLLREGLVHDAFHRLWRSAFTVPMHRHLNGRRYAASNSRMPPGRWHQSRLTQHPELDGVTSAQNRDGMDRGHAAHRTPCRSSAR